MFIKIENDIYSVVIYMNCFHFQVILGTVLNAVKRSRLTLLIKKFLIAINAGPN